MPGPILGGVPDAAMNLAFPLAVYAAVSRQLGEKLKWPGDAFAFQAPGSMSSSMMNGRHFCREPDDANKWQLTWKNGQC